MRNLDALILLFVGDFVQVVPTQVEEGGDVVITSENLRLLLDYSQLGMTQIPNYYHRLFRHSGDQVL
jgi:hypothetical protein